MMFGVQNKVLGIRRVMRTSWKSFQISDFTIQYRGLRSCGAPAAAIIIGISSRGLAAGAGSSVGIIAPSVVGVSGFGTTRKWFTSSSQLYRRRYYDAEDEHAINKHLNNPLNKYLDQVDDSSEQSLEDIAREQRRKIQSAKRARAAREFNRGPEKRTLSWDAIQQIHYLRNEDPEEWSVALLAESFNVSEEAIVKVLKSKFRPSARTKLKQDLVAAENTGYVSDGTGGNCLNASVATVAIAGSSEGKEKRNNPSMKARGFEKLQSERRSDGSAVSKRDHLSSTSHTRRTKRDKKPSHDAQREENEEEKHPEVEFSFGNIDFENVDSLMGQVKLKPQVFRKGRNFYNEHGEFLYRI